MSAEAFTFTLASDTDAEKVRSFIDRTELFKSSKDSILDSLSDKESRTHLLLKDGELKGFIQGKCTEINFIAVEPSLQRNGVGRKIYNYYLSQYEADLPGFVAHVDRDDLKAQGFWKRMGFTRQSDYFWSTSFHKLNSSFEGHNTEIVKIELFNDYGKKLDISFETKACFIDSTWVFQELFVYYKQSADNLLHITIGEKKLEPKKIKYAEDYGVKIVDRCFVVISEIPTQTLEAFYAK